MCWPLPVHYSLTQIRHLFYFNLSPAVSYVAGCCFVVVTPEHLMHRYRERWCCDTCFQACQKFCHAELLSSASLAAHMGPVWETSVRLSNKKTSFPP